MKLKYLTLVFLNLFQTGLTFYGNQSNVDERKPYICPKYHHKTNTSCFMYFLITKTHEQAISYCKNYSDHLVEFKNKQDTKDLLTSLNQFNLNSYEFFISSNLTLNSEFFKHCKSNFSFKSETNSCLNLKYVDGIGWCIEALPCNQLKSFICEWKADLHRRYNLKLGKVLRDVFMYSSLGSLVFFLILVYLLMDAIRNYEKYSTFYNEKMKTSIEDNRNGSFGFKKRT